MAPTSATRWFIHAKTQEFEEELQQYNFPAIPCLND
jgi:hypothetical protein